MRSSHIWILLLMYVGKFEISKAGNCGSVVCSLPQYIGRPSPAAIQCTDPCTAAACCTAVTCSNSPSVVLAAGFATTVADTTGCDAVAEPACATVCLAGYEKTTANEPSISCTAADTWSLSDPCQPISCGAFTLAAANNVQQPTDVTSCDTVPETQSCTLTCLAGYQTAGGGVATTVSCTGVGAYVVAPGPCTEISCLGYTLPTGFMTSALADACPLTGGNVAAAVLTAATNTACSLECLAGYSAAGVKTLSCSPTQLQPATTLTCTEVNCNQYPLLAGMAAGTCTVTNGNVAAGVLKAVTTTTCNLACGLGYTQTGGTAVALTCSPTQLTPQTTLTCDANVCVGALTPPTRTTLGAALTVAQMTTGATIGIGTTAASALVVDDGYYCLGTPISQCQAGALSTTGVTCTVISCATDFADWATNNVIPISLATPADFKTAPGAAKALTCTSGYKNGGGGGPMLDCVGTKNTVLVAGSYVVTNPCVPKTCSVAFGSAMNRVENVVTTGCDTVPEGTCSLTCSNGYQNNPAGPPTLSCTDDDTWVVTNPCVSLCSSDGLTINGVRTVATGIPSPATTTCQSGTGFLLKAGSTAISCTAPAVVADPAVDCQLEVCCEISCGFYSCPTGFRLKTSPNQISCGGHLVASCATATCCDQMPCNPTTNTPTVVGAIVSCSGITSHGASCSVVPNAGYSCTGAVTCSATSSDTGTYDSTVTCSTIACPPHSTSPPTCTCDAGYSGTAVWLGTSWKVDSCTAQPCTCTSITNSVSYSSANSLCGNTDTVIPIVCNTGFQRSAATTTCIGATGAFETVTCAVQGCPATQIANSLLYSGAGSVTGSTGTQLTVVCSNGYVGSGTDCPAACKTTCDGTSFSVVTCSPTSCPAHASPVGTCTCDSGYTGTPTWDATNRLWTHTCMANCGLHSCSAAFNPKSPATSFSCGSESVADCDDSKCCNGVVVTPTTGLQTSEGGGQATFTAVLVSAPTSVVTIGIRSSNSAEGTVSVSALVFQVSNWNIPQTITVTGVQDNQDDGNQDYTIITDACVSADANYNSLQPPDVTVTNLDNDLRGITVTPVNGLVVSERQTSSQFTVVLDTRPTATVTITATSSDLTEGLLRSSTTPVTLSFSTVDWNIPQTILVSGVNDEIADGDQSFTVRLANAVSIDPIYSNLPINDVTVTNEDDDSPGITVSPTTGLVTTENGGTATATLRLQSEPTKPVTIGIATNNVNEGVVNPASVTFSQTNWNQLVTITVTGRDDAIADGTVLYQVVTSAATSEDGKYNGLDADDINVQNTDNDEAGFTVSPTTGLITSEDGGSAIFTVRLNSQPINDVTVVIASNSDEVSFSTPQLIFTAANYAITQTVTLTGQDDQIDDDTVDYTVAMSSTSVDTMYNGITLPGVSCKNTDNDQAGVSISPTAGLQTTEAGGTATIEIMLNTQPVSGVVIVLTGDDTEGVMSPSSLSFNFGDWNVPKTVTITGVNDFSDDGDINYMINVVVTSSDLKYNGISVTQPFVTNVDDDTRGISISPTSGLVTTETGGSDSFTIQLDSQPSSGVQIQLSSSDTTEGTVLPDLISFTTNDWNVPRTVVVTGVQDDVQDGDKIYTIVTSASISSDVQYSGMHTADVIVTNNDDDTPSITVTPLTGITTTEDGGRDEFTLVLGSIPSGTVTISLSTDTTEASLSVESVSFSSGDWNIPKTVSVTGVNDDVADGDVTYTIVTEPAVSSDSNYNTLNTADISGTNTDNDEVGVTVSPTTGITTSEDGTSGEFTLILGSEPTADVTFGFSGDTTEGSISPSSLVFSSSNWNILQTVTVTGVDDDTADGSITYTIITNPASSLDSKYSGLAVPDVEVTNSDNDVAGVQVSEISGQTTEGGQTATFTAVLVSKPVSDISFTLTSDNSVEGSVSPSALTFTQVNWNIPQTATATGIDDFVDDGNVVWNIVTGTITSTDSAYNNYNPNNVEITNVDDDSAGITIVPTTGLITTEVGGFDTFSVVLNTQPVADVTIVLSSDTREGIISHTSLVFDAQTWRTEQTVRVTGQNDFIDDGDVLFSVTTNPCQSLDLRYDGFNPPNVAVTNRDDDVAGISVTPTTGLITTESGGTAAFSVVLETEPVSGVEIPVNPSDITEGTAFPRSLVFSSGNWNVPHTVIITGADDSIDDGDVAYTIQLGAAVSSDMVYKDMNPSDVSVTNTDDDTPDFIVSDTTGLVTTEAGGVAIFTIRLASEPEAAVTVSIESSNEEEGTVSVSMLVFSQTQWNLNQQVIVTGVNDEVDDGDIPYTIRTNPAVSNDPKYNNLNPPDISITNTNDDTAGVEVSPISGLSTSEMGAVSQFWIVLSSRPLFDVSIGLSSDNPAEGVVSISSIVFTNGNWNVPVTVTITGQDDQIDDGDLEYTIATSAATSQDGKYDGVNPADVVVINIDDDTVGVSVTPNQGLLTSELGTTTHFTITLDSEPNGQVLIPLTSTDTTEGIVSPNEVIFIAANWNVPQTVTITGQDDSIFDGDATFIISLGRCVSQDNLYENFDPSDVAVANLDNDIASVVVSPTEGLMVSEAGESSNFTVVLSSQPLHDVTIILKSEDLTEGITEPSQVTFTSLDWSIRQTIRVSGVDDFIADKDQRFIIRPTNVISADNTYNGISPAGVLVTNVDNETSGVSLSATSLSTSETGTGNTSEFWIQLQSEPVAGVRVTFESSDTTEGVLSTNNVLFTSLNWNVRQTVTVTGIYDRVVDGDQSYQLSLATVTVDPEYRTNFAGTITIVNRDVLDECTTSGSICQQVGQGCTDADTSPSSLNDWTCQCIGSSAGSARAAQAICVFNSECITQASTCVAAGQSCVDPGQATGNWRCECVYPQSGTSVTAGAATCTLDECELHRGVCTTVGQVCVDPNQSPTSLADWECHCRAPMVGQATARAASCDFKGECASHSETCTQAGQTCDDPNLTRLGDWECLCIEPAIGRETTARVRQCVLDECTLYGVVCSEIGQTCNDPNTDSSSIGDWTCTCTGNGIGGIATAMPATCIFDECAGNSLCADSGQMCVDENTAPASTGNWACHCIPPAIGSATGQVATCTFAGECAVHWSTCAAAGQTCFDPDTNASNDWQCICVPPHAQTASTVSPAVCVFDECTDKRIRDICGASGQACLDPNTDPNLLNDWRCECIESLGSKVGAPAECTYFGECSTYNNICNNAGQTCVDNNTNVQDDWTCRCVPPMTGSAVGGAAVCQLDECDIYKTVCNSIGQLCVDPNVSPQSTDDWRCECPSPATGSARARAATCSFSGECVFNAHICNSAGQTCKDSTTDVANDWQCVCLPPATGSATASTASCRYDECAANNAICAAAGQRCTDPNTSPSVLNDWICECTGGQSTGSAQGKPATCINDECVANANVCHSVGQLCSDPNKDPSATDDWQCLCPSPATGSATRGVATCQYKGECVDNFQTCSSQDQTCFDPDSTVSSNWECECIPPLKGTGIMTPANCVLDECDLHENICFRVGQSCNDVDKSPTSTGDWTCTCTGSSSGSAVASAAVCVHERECSQRHSTCTVAGQGCQDTSTSKSGDWECICVTPYTGKSTASPATCQYDECSVNSKVCTTVGQKCNDPNTSPQVTGDWTCSCVGSNAVGEAVGRVATCKLDECTIHEAVCTSVGQTCSDPDTDPSSTGNWQCNCVSPSSGSARAAPASCSFVGECVNSFVSSICTEAGQNCNDPNTQTSDDWQCECIPPKVGVLKGGPAICIFDECIEFSNICAAAGQVCNDPNLSPLSRNDWTCNCNPSGIVDGIGLQGPAVCTFQGECEMHSAVCTQSGQTCVDPDTTRTGDWQCRCVEPQTGRRTAGIAECILNECDVRGYICNSVGQECIDDNTNPKSLNDWKCSCILPATGSALGAAAVCSHTGECIRNFGICAAVGQTCVDPDSQVSNDWECRCISPQTGRAVGRPASCVLNECKIHGTTCTTVAQQCMDPKPTLNSLGDWRCECLGSASGSAVAKTAECSYTGSCASNGHVCTAVSQACFVPDISSNEWRCACVSPMVGSSIMGPANCTLDECVENDDICRSSGQVCEDPNTSPSSINDWKCVCVAPAVGFQVRSPAQCAFSGECVNHGHKCAASGQTCRDPDTSRSDDWQCICLEPAIGVATGKPATCELDECVKHRGVCESFDQVCHDPSPASATQGDWICTCVGSSQEKGSAVGKPASCILDECETHGRTCRDVGQLCNDPNTDPASTGDWTCSCTGSGLGEATATAATCTYTGECSQHNNICTTAGQLCLDPDEDVNSVSDWQCRCIPPTTGPAATASAATCIHDECVTYASICEAASQTCSDPNTSPTSLGDWRCECSGQFVGTAVGRVATCSFVGECVANAITCTAVGQTCRDPDTSVSGDWECICTAPEVGTSSLMSPATCTLDECGTNGNVCTSQGQFCEDLNTNPASIGDWTCGCVPPSVGQKGTAAAAVCTYSGECVENAQTCIDAGQTCIDPSPAVGDWGCVCIPPSTGRGVASVVPFCKLDECTFRNHICRAAGQVCTDPDQSPTSTGDWLCECLSPAVGSAKGQTAECVYEGECQTKSVICRAAGQTCTDPSNEVGDWKCACISPQVGESTAAIATCTYDECTVKGNICTAVGQICIDRNPSVSNLDDWICECVLPSTGIATASVATCTLDECTQNGQVCSQESQYCEDPSHTKTGDWRCLCVSPRTGFGIGTPAVCILDECSVHSHVCQSVGQLCRDSNTGITTLNDWTCNCVGSATGSSTASVASCTYSGECSRSASTCIAAGQTCNDPSDTDGDWECKCVHPMVGAASGTTATCIFDECTLHGSVCVEEGQTCNDPNTSPTSTNDWECSCSQGAGSSVARVANCFFDECQENGNICLRSGQICHDPNTSPSSKGDWVCTCTGSSTGSTTAGIATCTFTDECAVHSMTCTASGQSCVDDNPTTLNDWKCICVQPSTGESKTAGPAICTLNECNLHGRICSVAGQSCVDQRTSPLNTDDWSCQCTGSGSGSAIKSVATCAYAGGCAANGEICTSAGQACVETGNTWECSCIDPAVGPRKTGVTTCIYDECDDSSNWRVCTTAQQVCFDPNTSPLSVGDWKCRCAGSAAAGSATAKPATCIVDECLTQNTVCLEVGQLCDDPNTSPSSLGDWTCSCLSSGSGTATAAAATCTFSGACNTQNSVCTSKGQSCHDPDTVTGNNNWECICVPPMTGRAVAGAATCVYDECLVNWKTCATAGQRCIDPNQTIESTNDWTCNCGGSSSGSAVGNPATCELIGECLTHGEVCTANSQVCSDPDTEHAGDWRCDCISPQIGSGATTSAAQCVLDECLIIGSHCSSVGQLCRDPNTDPSSLNDWTCDCVAPATGTALGKPATCVEQGECVTRSSVCSPAGQSCEDSTGTGMRGDWECKCITPAVGRATAKVAECTLDECSIYRTVCSSVGQVCADPNTDSQSTGDWECQCVGATGKARAKVAVCLNNECDTAANRQTCERVGQTCNDPQPLPGRIGDWTCNCPASATGTAVGKPAVCVYQTNDECRDNAATCIAANQLCIDPDRTVTGNWFCMCPAPALGDARGAAATCVLDECVQNMATCKKSGQTCTDPNPTTSSIGDWKCLCGGNATGEATAAVASCTYRDECTVYNSICSTVGQVCVDPDSNVANDWECQCVAPAQGEPSRGRIADCTIDECKLYRSICSAAGQRCTDSYQSDSQIDDWVCECEGSGSGVARGKPASCQHTDECRGQNLQVCTSVGQSCRDASTASNDWSCECVSPFTGTQLMGAAVCKSAGECIQNDDTCLKANQVCNDPNPQTPNDWQCNCKPPASGTALMSAASCSTPSPPTGLRYFSKMILRVQRSLTDIVATEAAFLTTLQTVLSLPSNVVRKNQFKMQLGGTSTGNREGFLAAIVGAVNDGIRSSLSSRNNFKITSWIVQTEVAEREIDILQGGNFTSITTEIDVVGGTSEERSMWLTELENSKSTLEANDNIKMTPNTLETTKNVVPREGTHLVSVAYSAADTAGETDVDVRVESSSSTVSNDLETLVNNDMTSSSSLFRSSGYAVTSQVSAATDCIANTTCSVNQTCSDSDSAANGIFSCTCATPLTGVGINENAVCVSPTTPTPIPTSDSDDDIIGLPRITGIIILVLIGVFVLCLIGGLIVCCTRSEKTTGKGPVAEDYAVPVPPIKELPSFVEEDHHRPKELPLQTPDSQNRQLNQKQVVNEFTAPSPYASAFGSSRFQPVSPTLASTMNPLQASTTSRPAVGATEGKTTGWV